MSDIVDEAVEAAEHKALLEKLVDLDEREGCMSRSAAAAFADMLRRMADPRFLLSRKQKSWIEAEAERLGVRDRPADNLFSSMAEERRGEHERRARRVVLPWEAQGYAKPLKPPGSR